MTMPTSTNTEVHGPASHRVSFTVPEYTATTAAATAAAADVAVDDENDLSAPAPSWQSIRPSDVALYQLPSDLAGELTWQDDHFEEDEISDASDSDSVVAVFDLDYELMEEHWVKVGWTTYGTSVVLFPQLLWIDLFGLIPCFLRKNVQWNIRSQHVAVTRSGVQFVRDRAPTCLGHPWTDSDRFVKTISFKEIDDCRVAEPAGRTLLWIDNTLHTVFVDTHGTTKSGGRASRSTELTISGLKNPEAFRSLVLAMKEYHTTE